MAGRVRGSAGGILAVLDLLDAGHGPALEAELIAHGLPTLAAVGTPALTWHAVFIFAQHLQGKPGNALAASVHGPGWQWNAQEQLLNGVSNMLQWLTWSKSKDASKPGAKPPTPGYLPGLEPVDKNAKHRGTATPISEVLEMLGPDAQEMYRGIAP